MTFQMQWKEYQKGPLNGIPSIGIRIYKQGQTGMEDVQVDLVSGKTMDLDMLRYYPELNTEETAIQKIRELVENLHDVNVVGKIPENMSAELMIRGFDPKGEIYSDEEREYAKQMKDIRKVKDLGRHICHAEKASDQEGATVVFMEKEEKKKKYIKWY